MSEGGKDLKYLKGFNSYFSSEAIKDALPKIGNTPQQCPFGLYAEQLSGSAFTVPRLKNQRSWLYRMVPSCKHLPWEEIEKHRLVSDFTSARPNPNRIRWNPLSFPTVETDFVDSLVT